MGSEIIPFDFETNAVRSVMIDGKPWWVAVDACRVLEINNASKAVGRLDGDQKGVTQGYTLGGVQTLNIVSQSGLLTLILRSDKPVAKRFFRWVTDVVLPALLRDGYYGIPPRDQQELEAKRAFYAALPEPHREKADARAEALRQIEALITDGARVGEALAEVSAETGIAVRTLHVYRRTVYMVPGADYGAAMAPRWSQPRGMQAACHPEVLRMFVNLRLTGIRVTDCYRRVSEAAAEQGWEPVPSERTLRRAVQRLLPAVRGRAAA